MTMVLPIEVRPVQHLQAEVQECSHYHRHDSPQRSSMRAVSMVAIVIVMIVVVTLLLAMVVVKAILNCCLSVVIGG